jgi:hypothetical protein
MFDLRSESDFTKIDFYSKKNRVGAPSAECKPEVQLIPLKIWRKTDFLTFFFLIYKPNPTFVLIIDGRVLVLEVDQIVPS